MGVRLTALAVQGRGERLSLGFPLGMRQAVRTESRFDLKFGMPGLTHDQVMTTIELYGTEVIPRVRELRNLEQPTDEPSPDSL